MIPEKEEAAGGNHTAVLNAHHNYTKPHLFQQDIIDAFRQALENAGLSTKEKITADSKLHRFHVEGDKPGSKNGWYVLYGDSLPAGSFGSWRTGQTHKWCAKAENTLTTGEREEFKRRMDTARKAREMEEQARRKAASDKAIAIWKTSPPATDDHPYLIKKGVRNHGLRFHKDTLVIPMRDSAGNFHSLQFIDGERNKRFLSGGRKKGCYFLIGNPTEALCICEGYATGASIYEATGYPVAIAFDAGNLKPVAIELRKKFPHLKIVICADNDLQTKGNPGVSKAKEAAACINGLLAVPPCAGDFNDWYNGTAT